MRNKGGLKSEYRKQAMAWANLEADSLGLVKK